MTSIQYKDQAGAYRIEAPMRHRRRDLWGRLVSDWITDDRWKSPSEGHSEAQWGCLKKDVMINFPLHGLIHYEESALDLQLIERATS